MQSTVLIIEDDPDVRTIIRDTLGVAGLRTLLAENGMAGLTRAREDRPDLVVLDLGLPDMDGTEVASRLHRTGNLPILVLTAQDALDRKVRLLEAGVDDYLVKPFHPRELVARVHTLLRRHRTRDELEVGALIIDVSRRQCTFQGVPLMLTQKEFDLLALFARQPGRVFSRPEIIGALWRGQGPESCNTIEVHVANLRGKLRSAGAYGMVRTVRGLGYALRDPTGAPRAAPGVMIPMPG